MVYFINFLNRLCKKCDDFDESFPLKLFVIHAKQKHFYMNIIQTNRFRMVQAVLNYLKNSPPAVLILIPLLSTLTTALETIVNAILAAEQTQSSVAVGAGTAKEAKKNALLSIANSIGRAVMSFAANTGNDTLDALMKQMMDRLDRIADAAFINNCKVIHEKAEENVASLGPVGVTQAVIDSLKDSITDYENLGSELRNKVSERGDATKAISRLLNEAMRLLKRETDPLVYSLTGQTSYVQQYKQNRIIIDLGHRHTQFKGITVNKETQMNLSEVEIEFRNSERSIKIKTDENGKYREQIHPDVYDLIATHPNFEPFTIEGVKIMPGEIKIENFELVPLTN
jgi:hypothetical protein